MFPRNPGGHRFARSFDQAPGRMTGQKRNGYQELPHNSLHSEKTRKKRAIYARFFFIAIRTLDHRSLHEFIMIPISTVLTTSSPFTSETIPGPVLSQFETSVEKSEAE